MTDPEWYDNRGQTLVKHVILRKYLERFAHIVGSVKSPWDSITYVDGFSGPWQNKSEKYEDTSFAIALGELRKARDNLKSSGKSLRIRCFFLEENPSAFVKLKDYCDKIEDAEIRVLNASFEESIPEILQFVNQGRNTFPFFFIDPTGWTGFSMMAIAPLLRHKPGEVLINFMMGHIFRFLDSDQGKTQESFKELFGSMDFKARIEGLKGQDKEDAVIEAYIQSLRTTGGFSRTCNAIILRPEEDRTHFHLIYATRSPKGVEVFKDAEKSGMAAQEKARAMADLQRRETETGMIDLFGLDGPSDTRHYDRLRDRYLNRAQAKILRELEAATRIPYERVLALIDSEPMVWESDLKEWIKAWVKDGNLVVEGLIGRQSVPKRNSKHFLAWSKKSSI